MQSLRDKKPDGSGGLLHLENQVSKSGLTALKKNIWVLMITSVVHESCSRWCPPRDETRAGFNRERCFPVSCLFLQQPQTSIHRLSCHRFTAVVSSGTNSDHEALVFTDVSPVRWFSSSALRNRDLAILVRWIVLIFRLPWIRCIYFLQ